MGLVKSRLTGGPFADWGITGGVGLGAPIDGAILFTAVCGAVALLLRGWKPFEGRLKLPCWGGKNAGFIFTITQQFSLLLCTLRKICTTHICHVRLHDRKTSQMSSTLQSFLVDRYYLCICNALKRDTL